MGYHLTNILWHAANAVVFYYLALALLRIAMPRAKAPLGAFLAALVFALHPLRAESVAWVTERRDVVSGLFYLLAILAYARGYRDVPGRPIVRKYYWACFTFFVLAILSKEIAVTLPAVLLILDVYPLRRLWSRLESRPQSGLPAPHTVLTVLLEKVPFFAIAAADSALAIYVGRQEGLSASLTFVNWFSRLAISAYGLAFYLWKTLLPFGLSPFYALTRHRVDPRALPFQLSAVVVVGLAAAAVMFCRRWPALPAVTLAYTVTLLPVLGIFQNGLQITADRYSYLACLGWALLAGGGWLAIWTARARVGKATLAVAAAFAIGTLGILNWRQVQIWRDSEALWTHALTIEPSAVGWNNLGLALAAREDYAGAIDQFHLSLAMDPDWAYSRYNLGISLLELHDWDGATREFQIALKLKPDMYRAHFGLGYALMMQGELDEAIAHFRTVLRVAPGDTAARNGLEQALDLKGKSAQSR